LSTPMAAVCPTTPRLDLVIPSESAYCPVAPAGIVVGPETVNQEPPEDVTACVATSVLPPRTS
jgi:hypothetical protein